MQRGWERKAEAVSLKKRAVRNHASIIARNMVDGFGWDVGSIDGRLTAAVAVEVEVEVEVGGVDG